MLEATAISPQPPPSLHVLRLVAHELRAHLTVLNGYADLLTREPAVRGNPEVAERAIAEMRAHLATLTEISAHLTTAAGGGEAGLRTAKGEVDLGEAAREAMSMASPVARRRNVRLRVDEGRLGSHRCVRADRFQLVVAMRNLLDNACTHGPRDSEVVLELARRGADAEVVVRDQGGGLGRLGAGAFEPLRRGEAGEAEGLGIGLSLVAEVARAHSGRVEWGRDDRGATVGLRFPAGRGA